MKSDLAQGQVLYDASEAIVLASRAQAAFHESDLVIDSDTMLSIAADDLKAVKVLQHLVEDRRTAITGPLNQALKQVNDLFRSPKDYLQQAESRLKAAILDYSRKQEALAAAARERAEAQMRLESQRLLREREHQQSLAQAAEQAAARATSHAQEAHLRGDLGAAALALDQARAQATLADEARETASATMLSAQVLTLPQVTAAPAKVDGLSGRTTYSVVVTDPMALVKAVASLQAPLECLCPDLKFLAAQARAMKRTGVIFPGVESRADRGLAVRR
jgi:hypothetical protein